LVVGVDAQGAQIGRAELTHGDFVDEDLGGAVNGRILEINVKGFAHITGGGITDNIPRVLPEGYEVLLQRRSWARDPVFDWLAATGKISAGEMYRTFNCGIGMIAVVSPGDVDAALATLCAGGETATVIGSVGRGTRGVVIEE
jgi:phosphoribosylformylglycinamidine cyclo-ligase